MTEYYLKLNENGDIPLDFNPAYFAGFNVYHRLLEVETSDEALTYLTREEAESVAEQMIANGFSVDIETK